VECPKWVIWRALKILDKVTGYGPHLDVWGTAFGTVFLHASPKSAIGGKRQSNGDAWSPIDVLDKSVHLEVSDEELWNPTKSFEPIDLGWVIAVTANYTYKPSTRHIWEQTLIFSGVRW
jgi:hypothetical protein